jgi:aminopeptidase
MTMMNRNRIANAAAQRRYPPFNLGRLLKTVFEPTDGKRICILIDLDDLSLMRNYGFLSIGTYQIQRTAHDVFFQSLHRSVLDELGMRGGEMYAYAMTYGSNLDLPETVVDAEGAERDFERDVYSRYDLILCISTYSATAPLTAFAKQYGFRGATMHGVNDVILRTGLSVDYNEVSRDAENLRLAMTRADEIEIDFALEDGRILTANLQLGAQEAQKSHGLCRGDIPDIANLPAGEVYFVPTSAHGEFPMKYEDGTLGVLTVRDGRVVRSDRISGHQETIDAHNRRLTDDEMTGVLGELGFGTQILPYSGADIQDEKILGTCHLATGRDDHLGGHIEPSMFKRRENATHDDILFAPHKTPNFDIVQARMRRGDQREILIEHFDPSEYLMNALQRE